MVLLRRLIRGDEGQDLMEYGLLACLIAIGGMLAVGAFGNVINTVYWQYIASSF